MDTKKLRTSISQVLKNNSDFFKKAAPVTIAVALAGISLIPGVKTGSSELVLGAEIISGIGVELLKNVGKGFLTKIGKKNDGEIEKELENQILKIWNTPGEQGTNFRRELSQFLQRNHILQTALEEAPQGLREGMAQSFANLANQFEEFGWVLDEIKDILEEIQKCQVEQMATQREQLELQREQLAKTNLLLKLHREHKGKRVTVSAHKDQIDTHPEDIPCPYKGLAAFQPEDADNFFGRESLIAEILARLAGATFLAVIGPSGSGKSSLVRAGLVPALWNGEIPGSESWKVLLMRPGTTPLEELAVRIALQSRISAASLLEDLRMDPHALQLAIRQFLAGQKEDTRFVLVVDQFEEVFTQCKDEQEKENFIASLIDVAKSNMGRMVVILTLRADFYGQCAAYSTLADLLTSNQVLVGAMSEEELRRAITLPAENVGLLLEPGLVELILQDAEGEAGALPMVSHALMETWKLRRGNYLKIDSYRAFGGVSKAIASTAEAVYSSCSIEEQNQLRNIFLRLTHLDDSGSWTEYRDTRLRVLLQDLIPAERQAIPIQRLLDKLAENRLIVIDKGRTLEPEVEVAHEALIQHWDRLRSWLSNDRDKLRISQGVRTAAHDWEMSGKEETFLIHRGGRLDDASILRKEPRYGASGFELAYLQACSSLQKKVQDQRDRVRKRITVGFGIGFTVVLVVALLAGIQWRRAEEQTKLALARQLASQSQLLFTNENSNRISSILLAIQSMRMFTSVEAAEVLQNNTLIPPLVRMTDVGAVSSIAFSPDGKYVVSGGEDGIVQVWDTTTGQKIVSMFHGERVSMVSFSYDNEHVLTWGDSHILRVWDFPTGSEVSHISTGNEHIAFSPDAKYMGVGGADGVIHIWDAVSGQEITSITHDGSVISFAFSSDGKLLVSGSEDGTARVWDAMTGIEVARATHNGPVESVAFSQDNKLVVSGGRYDLSVRIWDAFTGHEIIQMTHDSCPTPDCGGIHSVTFSPDGIYVVALNDNGTARIWEISTGREISNISPENGLLSVGFSADGRYIILQGGNGTFRVVEFPTGVEIARLILDDNEAAVSLSTDGKYIVSGTQDGSIVVWDMEWRVNTYFDYGDEVFTISFSPDGQHVAAGGGNSTARVWDVITGQVTSTISHDSYYVVSVAFSPDGEYLISGSDDNTARVWDAMTGQEISRMIYDDYVTSVAFSPDGQYVVSGSGDGTARVWDARTGHEISRMTYEYPVSSVAFSPDGKYVVSGSDDGARVWDAMTGLEVSRMIQSGVTSVAFSSDGHYVVSGGGDRTARVRDAWTGHEISRMTYEYPVNSVAFSPDGKYVVSGSNDGTARVWDTRTGQELARMTHYRPVTSVAFSPDGINVISGSWDGTARVWDAMTGQELARMTHDDYVTSVAFSPDGKFALSGSWDSTVIVWLYHSGDLIADACMRVTRNLTRAEWKQYIGDSLPFQAVCPDLPIEP